MQNKELTLFLHFTSRMFVSYTSYLKSSTARRKKHVQDILSTHNHCTSVHEVQSVQSTVCIRLWAGMEPTHTHTHTHTHTLEPGNTDPLQSSGDHNHIYLFVIFLVYQSYWNKMCSCMTLSHTSWAAVCYLMCPRCDPAWKGNRMRMDYTLMAFRYSLTIDHVEWIYVV